MTRGRIISLSVAAVAILALIIYSAGLVGVSAKSIEKDARKNQHIDDSWLVSQATGGGLCAMIFFDEAVSDYTYSVYLNRSGPSLGYFFSQGGESPKIETGVELLSFDSNGSALLSMNRDRVARIELDNDVELSRIDVDPDKPFAAVIPTNSGKLTLYDENGNEVIIDNVIIS